MCFSASVSFSVASLLAIIGTLTIAKIKSKYQLPFSLIPYFFSIQQFAEGLLWMAHQGNQILSSPNIVLVLTYIFLFFGLFFWPLWIPFSVFVLEKNKLKKTLLFVTLMIGIIITIYFGYFMVIYGVDSKIISNHIFYDIKVPYIYNFDLLFYLIATVLPFYISSVPALWFLGTLILIALYITYFFYIHFLISIWCFFAAVLSIFVYLIVVRSANMFEK